MTGELGLPRQNEFLDPPLHHAVLAVVCGQSRLKTLSLTE